MNKTETSMMMLCAARYALGRRSCIVKEVADVIERNLADMYKDEVAVLAKDIDYALERGFAGGALDWEVWDKLLTVLHDWETQNE